MSEQCSIKFTLDLHDSFLDDRQLQKLTEELISEMKDLDGIEHIGGIEIEQTTETPKAFGALQLGKIVTLVSPSNTKTFLSFIGSRLHGRMIELEVEAKDKKLKLKATTPEEVQTLVEAARRFISE